MLSAELWFKRPFLQRYLIFLKTFCEHDFVVTRKDYVSKLLPVTSEAPIIGS